MHAGCPVVWIKFFRIFVGNFFICRSRNVREDEIDKERKRRDRRMMHVKCMLIWKQDEMKNEPVLDPTKKNESRFDNESFE